MFQILQWKSTWGNMFLLVIRLGYLLVGEI